MFCLLPIFSFTFEREVKREVIWRQWERKGGGEGEQTTNDLVCWLEDWRGEKGEGLERKGDAISIWHMKLASSRQIVLRPHIDIPTSLQRLKIPNVMLLTKFHDSLILIHLWPLLYGIFNFLARIHSSRQQLCNNKSLLAPWNKNSTANATKLLGLAFSGKNVPIASKFFCVF